MQHAENDAAEGLGPDIGDYKIRYSYEPRLREEWLLVPVPDAGIPREVVEAARQMLKDNTRKHSGAAERSWELCGGLLRCGLRPYLEAAHRPQEGQRRTAALLRLLLPLQHRAEPRLLR